MADQYIGVNGVARKVKKDYIGVGGVARKVKSGYIGVDGVARKFFSGFDPANIRFTYTGAYQDRGVEQMEDGIFRVIQFTGNGILTFQEPYLVDLFGVGGGGSGGAVGRLNGVAASGGGGGYTTTVRDFACGANTPLSITIGAGGIAVSLNNHGRDGGATTISYNGAVRLTANGGYGGSSSRASGGKQNAGAGGSSGGYSRRLQPGNGGSDGGTGVNMDPGSSQGSTTREFGLKTGTLYSGGGGGSYSYTNGEDVENALGSGGAGGGGDGGTINGKPASFYGGGGGGAAYYESYTITASGAGYQGIVVIRIKAAG